MATWRVARSAAGAAVVAAAVAVGLVVFGPQGGVSSANPYADVVATTLAPPTAPPPTAPPPIAPPPTAPPALSTPVPPPVNPYADVPIVAVGELAIPKIGLERTVNEGVELTVIDRGPAHWPGSAAPGGWGNTVILAHRTVHDGPFLGIAELVAGDPIVVRDAEGTHVYVVTSAEVVTPEALWIVDQHPGRTITLVTCHPIGSAAQRYVVHGRLASGAV